MEDMMPASKNTQSGFSLIELLIAIVILAIGLLGLAELQITAMRVNSKSQGILAATSLAQEMIENVIALDSADSMFDSTVLVTDVPWPGGPISLAGGGTYNVTYDMEPTYQGVTNLCRVRINVTPANAVDLGDFTNRTASMTTLKRAS
jgi:prepilin-type N-terminal cleavage/methylation domain-containing protein